jgi:kinase suppressor of Ras 2
VDFLFSPDVSHKQEGVTLETHPLVASPALEEVIETHKSNDSDRTVSASGSGSISTDSEQTPVRVDSQDSQVSDGEAVDRTWPRQNSVSTIFLKIKVI